LWMDQFNSKLLDMSMLQARARLDAVVLTPVEIDEMHALDVARENRLDWMNARTALVDRWRKIEIAANALKSDVTVTANVQSGLENSHKNSTLSLGLSVDTPVDRRTERNNYVETLISYDRARREYLHYEDSVHKNIRTLVRQVQVAQLNFELRRISVFVAMNRVDQANLQLLQPPKPNQTSQFGDSFARDLIDALNSLLSAQNTFVESWIGFETCRMGIEISLGIFQLDGAGVWVDRGKLDIVNPGSIVSPGSAELAPITGQTGRSVLIP
ncbi:MAG: TolC family protein, partial [Thermoguttaceae bacterium]|nr:TolC family protein [Thermoguttaceae bacterium]